MCCVNVLVCPSAASTLMKAYCALVYAVYMLLILYHFSTFIHHQQSPQLIIRLEKALQISSCLNRLESQMRTRKVRLRQLEVAISQQQGR